MAPVTKKSKTEAVPGSDSAVELAPLPLTGNSTKRNLEQPMANEAKRFKRSEASSDISHSATNTGKQPRAMHTDASTKFHYLDSPFSSDDEQFPSMPFVKSPKSSSTKTTSQQTEDYVAKVEEAADQEFDKWKQQQEVQAASKAATLAASAASNTPDNSEKLLHPITDNTSHQSSVHKSSPIKEQARSALQSIKSPPQSDFTNLNSNSDDQNSNDQVPSKSTASTTHNDDLSATTDGDEIPEVTSTSSTHAVTTPSRLSLVQKKNTLFCKTQFFFTEKNENLFCRLLVNRKTSSRYCKQCPYSISSNDPNLMMNAGGHLKNSHGLRASDVKGNQYVQVINTGTGSLRITIDFTVSTTHSAHSDILKLTQPSTLKAAPNNPIATSPPIQTATTTTRPSLVEEKEKESFQYKCQSFFIKRGDHFYCRLVNQNGLTCNGSVTASPDPDPTSLMMFHLQDIHHICYLDVKEKEVFFNSYDLGIRRGSIDFNEPLLEEIVQNAPAVQQRQATFASSMAYNSQFFFTLKNNRLFCRLLINKKMSSKYCMQCPYSISSNDPKLMISTINHLRHSHGLRAPDVQGNEYVQIIDNKAKRHRVTIDFTASTAQSTHGDDLSAPDDDDLPFTKSAQQSSTTEDVTYADNANSNEPAPTTSSPTQTSTTTTRSSLVEEKEKESFKYKCQSFFIKRGDHFFCRLVNQDGHTCNGSVAASPDPDPTSLMMSHLQDVHHINYLDVKEKEKYINSYDLGIHRVIIDFDEPLLEETVQNAPAVQQKQQQHETPTPTTHAVTPSRIRASLVPVADTLAYKCQYFFVPDALQPDRFRCRLIDENGHYKCSRKRNPLKAGPSYLPVLGLSAHLSARHGIHSENLVHKDEYVHKSSKGKTVQTINLTGPLPEADDINSYDLGIRKVSIDSSKPLLEAIVPNAPEEQQHSASTSTTLAVTTSIRISQVEEQNSMTYKCQFFFTQKGERLFCRLLVNRKKSSKYCKQCPYSISSNDPKLLLHASDHLRGAHDLCASDVKGDEYVQVINTGAGVVRVIVDFTGPLPVGTVREAAQAQKQRRFEKATDEDDFLEASNLPSVRQQKQISTTSPILASTHSKHELSEQTSINLFGCTFRKPQPPNRSISADKELTIYSMFHRSLLYLVNSPEYLQTTLNEIKQVDTAFRAEAEAKFCLDPTNPQLHCKLFYPINTTYIHLNKTQSFHPLELLNHTFYAGMTDDFKQRQEEHLGEASRMYFAPSYQAVSTTNPNLYEHIAEGWKNENPFYMPKMSEKRTQPSAAFHEHILIKCLMSSPLCKNGTHGSTTPFKALLKQEDLTMERRAKYGLAKLIAGYQKLDFEANRPFDVISRFAPKSIKDCDFLKEVANRRNTVKQPVPTAYSLANQAAIPNFSQVDGSGELKYLFRYAVYLFTSLFTIPPKLALWYLHREGSIDLIELIEIDSGDRRQDYLMSISAIVVGYPVTLADCIKWARQLFTLIFDTNVRLVNVQRATLNLPELYPISIDDVRGSKQIENFIIATARLRARLYNLKDENGGEPSHESLEVALSLYLANLIEPEQVLFSNRFTKDKPYRKITHFTDLADVCSLPSPADIIIPGDPQFDPEYLRNHLSITPIEPYSDDDLVFDFIKAVYRLRFFNLKNRFTEDQHTDEVMLYRAEFPVPYFRQASLFPQFL